MIETSEIIKLTEKAINNKKAYFDIRIIDTYKEVYKDMYVRIKRFGGKSITFTITKGGIYINYTGRIVPEARCTINELDFLRLKSQFEEKYKISQQEQNEIRSKRVNKSEKRIIKRLKKLL